MTITAIMQEYTKKCTSFILGLRKFLNGEHMLYLT